MAKSENKKAMKAIIEVLEVSDVKEFDFEVDERENGQIVKDTKGNPKKIKKTAVFQSVKYCNHTTGEIEDTTMKPEIIQTLGVAPGKKFTMFYDRIEIIQVKNKFNHAIPYTGNINNSALEDIPFQR